MNWSIFSQILIFLKQQVQKPVFRRVLMVSGIFFLGFLALSDTTFAQFSFTPTAADSNDTLKGIAEFASLFIKILTFVNLLVLSLAGDLLGTEFITGDEAMAALRPMWVFVRNLTNIGFVVALVYLAFSNLFASFGAESNSLWKIKEKLPRIIFAIIAVNFSLLGFRLMIDAVNVGTTAVLGIADVQLESQSSTSVDRILKNPTWSIIAEPDDIADTSKYEKQGNAEGVPRENDQCELPDNLGEKTYYSDTFRKKQDDPDKYKEKIVVCRSFLKDINQMFCPSEKDQCFFKIKEDLTRSTFITASDSTAQNLFMSFGTVFMRLETLPALAADVKDILQVIDNTLFSLIMALAYGIVLVMLLIILVVRVVVLWLGMVFSPALVAGGIMGFGTGSISEKLGLFTYLLAPIKIAAAFAVSFVMMSGLIEFRPHGKEGIFEFGAGLSALAVDEYAILWQIATIVVFWMAAKTAIKDIPFVDGISDKLLGGAERVGSFLARSATTEAQVFTVETDQGPKKIGLGGLLNAPARVVDLKESQKRSERGAVYQSLAGFNSGEEERRLFDYEIQQAKNDRSKVQTAMDKYFKEGAQTINGQGDDAYESIKKAFVAAKIPLTAEVTALKAKFDNGVVEPADLAVIGQAAGIGSAEDLIEQYGGNSQEKTSSSFIQEQKTNQSLSDLPKEFTDKGLNKGEIGVGKNSQEKTVQVALPTNGTFATLKVDMNILESETASPKEKQDQIQTIMNTVAQSGVDEKALTEKSKNEFLTIFGQNKENITAVLKDEKNGLSEEARKIFKGIFGEE